MDTKESINQFCSYFEYEAIAIAQVNASCGPNINSGAGNPVRYRKVLYVTTLDTLAGFRFHKSEFPDLARKNRQRFTRFLSELGSWSDGEFVSIPFLNDQLLAEGLLETSLGKYVSAQLSKFSTNDGGSLSISDIDLPYSTLLPLAETEKEKSILREYQHFSLLYRYRNSLVHDSRQPGSGMEGFSTSKGSYYHGYIQDPKFYLVYPLFVFESLLKNSIAAFRDYLEQNQIDPYSLIDDKARW